MNYYDVLEIASTSTYEEIRSAYKKLALLYHPDRNPQGKERFQIIADAYNILSDKALRKKYDLKQKIDYCHKNAFDTWKSLFPEGISQELLSKIVKQLFDKPIEHTHFELIYKYILDRLKVRSNGKKRTLYIKAYYEISKLFMCEYEKDIVVEMTDNDKSYKWEYQLDIRQPLFYFLEEIKEGTASWAIHININLIPRGIPKGYQIKAPYDLIVDIPITIEEYYQGVHLTLYHFGEYLVFNCYDIPQSYMLYKIPHQGLPYSKEDRGHLYLKLVLKESLPEYLPYILKSKEYNIHILSKNRKKTIPYTAIPVDFFNHHTENR